MKTINLQNNQRLVCGIAAACLFAATVGAHANEVANDAPARTVHFADLNLNTPAGAAALYQRIRNAAAQVCGDVGTRDLQRAAAAQACVERAIAASVRFVNKPQLTTEYNAHFGVAQKPIKVAAAR